MYGYKLGRKKVYLSHCEDEAKRLAPGKKIELLSLPQDGKKFVARMKKEAIEIRNSILNW